MNLLNPQMSVQTIKEPFNFVVADNFLQENSFKALAEYHRNLLNHAPLSETPSLSGFGKMEVEYRHHNGQIFDTYTYPVFPRKALPATVFYGRELFSWVQQMFNWIPFNGDVYASLRHNPPMLSEDFIHSDYCSVQFHNLKNVSDPVNPYFADLGSPNTHEATRAITAIYYLNNDDWQKGDGGETALYKAYNSEPAHLIEPLNNRFFLFEISPHSLHRYMKCQKPRNAIVATFHTTPEFQEERFSVKPKLHYLYE